MSISKKSAEDVLRVIRQFVPAYQKRRLLLFKLSQVQGNKSFADSVVLMMQVDKEREQVINKVK